MTPSIGQQRLIKAYNLIAQIPPKYISLRSIGLRKPGTHGPSSYGLPKITNYQSAREQNCYGGPAGWLGLHPDMNKEGLFDNEHGDPVFNNKSYERGLLDFFELKDSVVAYMLFGSVEAEVNRGGTKIAYPQGVNERDRWLIRVKHQLIEGGVPELGNLLMEAKANAVLQGQPHVPKTENEVNALDQAWEEYKKWGHEYGY